MQCFEFYIVNSKIMSVYNYRLQGWNDSVEVLTEFCVENKLKRVESPLNDKVRPFPCIPSRLDCRRFHEQLVHFCISAI